MADHSRVLHGWSTAISTDGCRSWHTSRTGGGCRGCGRRLSERKTRLSVSLPGNLGPAARGYIDSPGDTPVRSVSAVFFASRVDNSRLPMQVRPTLDHRPDRSRSL